MKYLAVLGRQPEISIAELEALFGEVHQISDNLAVINTNFHIDINRLGGTLKLAVELDQKPLDFLRNLPDGKITFGISDYSAKASRRSTQLEALKLKKILVRHGRSVRVVEGKDAVLSTATSLHNGLGGQNARKVELIKAGREWYRVIGIQNIDAYTRRDQARPARDAKVGMLPPKLAQILINLCGPLPPGTQILDPFCGTGVVLQEALLMGYRAYGTDVNERMVEYSRKNLEWLRKTKITNVEERKGKIFGRKEERRREACLSSSRRRSGLPKADFAAEGAQQCDKIFDLSHCEASETCDFCISQSDATNYKWAEKIDAVACEGYLGRPFSKIPTDIELKKQQQECQAIILGFLKNLATQIEPDTPVVIAAPAWLRENGSYERLKILDFLSGLGYNVNNKSREGLIYCRVGQIVARDIIILRKT